MANILTNVLSEKKRQRLYVAFALIGLAITCVQTGFLTAEVEQPVWLAVTISVFGVVSTTFGFTAASNIHHVEK